MYIRRVSKVQSLLRYFTTRYGRILKIGIGTSASPSSATDHNKLFSMPTLSHIESQRENTVQVSNMNVALLPGAPDQAFISGRKIMSEWKRRLKMSSYRGTAVFVLGAMGSGKSTVIEKEFMQHPEYRHYAYVDTDGFMEMLDGFSPEKVELYYPIAREVAIYLTDWLLTENISFVAEGTCVKFLELEDYMERLRDTGYSIKVRRIDSPPLETVLERSRRRVNRKLSDDLVSSIFYGSRHGIEQLFKLNKDCKLFKEI